MQIQSILTQITEITNQCNKQNFVSIQNQIITFIDSSKIKSSDKLILISKIKSINNTIKLQQYIYNALLKYEGLGVNA